MKLYNTLSKSVQEIKPITKGRIGLYTCGPTVYDHIHIGNLRTYIVEDVLRRYLKVAGHKIKHVINVTDVDDKTIARSKAAHANEPPGIALKKLTSKFEEIFLNDAAKVGIDFSNSKLVKATEHIKGMQDLILRLVKNGYAYTAADGIYFSVAKYAQQHKYGELSGIERIGGDSKSRIAADNYDKNEAKDFALWKAKKGNEPTWQFKLEGRNLEGRPGWHIECSAMSTKYLGQPFDIHTGGVDLIFPHHENEIAQSQAAIDKRLANLFMHTEHLLVNGKKMSKSLNNFYTLTDIVQKSFSPMAFRLLVLQAHYRSQLNFTWKSLTSAQNFLQDLYALSVLRYQTVDKPADAALGKLLSRAKEALTKALEEDLNTPQAISTIAGIASYLAETGLSNKDAKQLKQFINFADEVLGLGLIKQVNLDKDLLALIGKRNQLREKGEYEAADKIRSQLKNARVALEDTAYGTIWYRLL